MIKYIKWLLPVIFITYYGSISLFMHVHIEHGTTIVHAHPFHKAANGGGHQHASLAEFQLYHHLSSLHVADGAVHTLLLPFYALPIVGIIEQPVCPAYLRPFKGGVLLRAPPFVA